MNSRFVKTSLDLGSVVVGAAINGDFVLTDKSMVIKKMDGGCTCGGKPRISCMRTENGFHFSTIAKRIGSGGTIIRNIIVDFNDGNRQIVSFRYSL